jgi:hypothetical protein
MQAFPRIALSVDSHIGELCLNSPEPTIASTIDLREATAAASAKRPGKYTGK